MDEHPLTCHHCGLPAPSMRRHRDGPVFCCYGCRIAHEIAAPGYADTAVGPRNTLLLRLGLGIFLTMNLMAFNGLLYWRHVFDPRISDGAVEQYEPIAGVVAYLLMFLGTLVMATLGVPMAADVVAESRGRWRIDANLLILIGVLSAYALSVINTLRGDDHLYFDTAAVILVLVTLGRYLDSLARTRATQATRQLLATLPDMASVRRDDAIIEIAAREIRRGDVVRVRPGETIPADGVAIEGQTYVDEASLTGESQPRAVAATDQVLAGTICLDGLIWIRAEAVGADLAIALMQRMLEEARLKQPRIGLLADRIAAVFVPGVVLLALGVFAHRFIAGDAVAGLLNALSVLLISCPCALGLAAPLATWTALGRAARRGILIDSGRTLERAAAARHVFFDKTGTLTCRQMRLVKIEHEATFTEAEALRLAASIESGSTHPIARTLLAVAAERRLSLLPLSELTTIAGCGLSAVIHGATYQLGRFHADQPREAQDGLLRIELMSGRRWLARFTLGEQLRGDALEAVHRLADMGITVEVLTGDQPGPARQVQQHLGVNVHPCLLPVDKVRYLEDRRTKHHGAVAMVGDGINDAPVLAAADVAFAMGSASDLARQAGHVHLINDSLLAVVQTLTLARHAMRRIRLNLVWAFGYNGVGLVLAAAGMLNPVIAALAMLGSSLFIVMTSRGAGDVRSSIMERNDTGVESPQMPVSPSRKYLVPEPEVPK